jgi:predicted DNA binding protein
MGSHALDLDGTDSAGEDSAVRMTITLPDPDAARDCLAFLGRALPETAFSVECVAVTESEPCVIHVDDVTPRQLSAVKAAVACGYYDESHDATLSDIAAELDRSEPAISQRLTAVERTLVCSLVEACED